MKPSWLDPTAAVIALAVIAVYAFTVVAPYFLPPQTNPDLIQLIDRSKGTVDTVTVAVIMFFFGASVGRSKDAESLHAMARVAETAQQHGPLAPGGVASTAVHLSPGETATVKADSA